MARNTTTSCPDAEGSHGELEQLLSTIKPRIERELRRYRIPGADSEDILQQAFLALVYQWHRVRSPEAWLFGTVRNQCRLYWKKKRGVVYRAVDLAVLDDLVRYRPPLQDRRDLWVDIESGLVQLGGRCQRLLRLRYQMGMSSSEIARCMGYSPTSVSKLTNRCLRSLTGRLAARSRTPGAARAGAGSPSCPDAEQEVAGEDGEQQVGAPDGE